MTPAGDIASARAQLRAGITTALALTEAALDAVGRHNGATNAFISIDADGARAAAREVDLERARGIDRGPLHGIPISLKDLIDVAGVVTTAASRVLGNRIAPADATVVTRLREAGAILFGRTNLHEFACGPTGEDSAYGAVHHPADHTRIAGGSSSGSAAAVATGMGLASIGSDTGGSIRIPAALCGVVGLKPSIGEVPLDGVIPLSVSLDHLGPLTRTVDDAAAVFAVLAGRRPAPIPRVPISALTFTHVGGEYASPLEPPVRTAIDRALARLTAVGATVRAGTIAAPPTGEIYGNLVLPEAAHWHAPYLDVRAHLYTRPVHERLMAGRGVSATAYLAALDARATLRRAVDAALEGCDALLLPTLPVVAPPIGTSILTLDGDTFQTRPLLLKHTRLFNLSGHPTLSLPVASADLPVGLQIVGRRGETGRLLSIAAACEAALASV